jgi:hypothetical protein
VYLTAHHRLDDYAGAHAACGTNEVVVYAETTA